MLSTQLCCLRQFFPSSLFGDPHQCDNIVTTYNMKISYTFQMESGRRPEAICIFKGNLLLP